MDLGKPSDQQVLGPVGVLVFVDHHVAELLGVLGADPLRLLEHVDRFQKEIVEVERVALLQRVQIVGIDLGNLLITTVPARRVRHRIRPLHLVLRGADAR